MGDVATDRRDAEGTVGAGDGGWDATWDDARRRKLTMGLAATPLERLRWLEEAIALAHRVGALPRPRR